jgi:FHA domain
MKMQLKPLVFEKEGGPIPVTGPSFRIGRADDCHLRLASSLISRHHCELWVGEDAAGVRDTNSRNGTFVNGVPVRGDHVLRDGDLLCLATWVFEVQMRPDPRQPPRPLFWWPGSRLSSSGPAEDVPGCPVQLGRLSGM